MILVSRIQIHMFVYSLLDAYVHTNKDRLYSPNCTTTQMALHLSFHFRGTHFSNGTQLILFVIVL